MLPCAAICRPDALLRRDHLADCPVKACRAVGKDRRTVFLPFGDDFGVDDIVQHIPVDLGHFGKGHGARLCAKLVQRVGGRDAGHPDLAAFEVGNAADRFVAPDNLRVERPMRQEHAVEPFKTLCHCRAAGVANRPQRFIIIGQSRKIDGHQRRFVAADVRRVDRHDVKGAAVQTAQNLIALEARFVQRQILNLDPPVGFGLDAVPHRAIDVVNLCLIAKKAEDIDRNVRSLRRRRRSDCAKQRRSDDFGCFYHSSVFLFSKVTFN